MDTISFDSGLVPDKNLFDLLQDNIEEAIQGLAVSTKQFGIASGFNVVITDDEITVGPGIGMYKDGSMVAGGTSKEIGTDTITRPIIGSYMWIRVVITYESTDRVPLYDDKNKLQFRMTDDDFVVSLVSGSQGVNKDTLTKPTIPDNAFVVGDICIDHDTPFGEHTIDNSDRSMIKPLSELGGLVLSNIDDFNYYKDIFNAGTRGIDTSGVVTMYTGGNIDNLTTPSLYSISSVFSGGTMPKNNVVFVLRTLTTEKGTTQMASSASDIINTYIRYIDKDGTVGPWGIMSPGLSHDPSENTDKLVSAKSYQALRTQHVSLQTRFDKLFSGISSDGIKSKDNGSIDDINTNGSWHIATPGDVGGTHPFADESYIISTVIGDTAAYAVQRAVKISDTESDMKYRFRDGEGWTEFLPVGEEVGEVSKEAVGLENISDNTANYCYQTSNDPHVMMASGKSLNDLYNRFITHTTGDTEKNKSLRFSDFNDIGMIQFDRIVTSKDLHDITGRRTGEIDLVNSHISEWQGLPKGGNFRYEYARGTSISKYLQIFAGSQITPIIFVASASGKVNGRNVTLVGGYLTDKSKKAECSTCFKWDSGQLRHLTSFNGIAESISDIVYAKHEEAFYVFYDAGKYRKTTDGGNTWSAEFTVSTETNNIIEATCLTSVDAKSGETYPFLMGSVDSAFYCEYNNKFYTLLRNDSNTMYSSVIGVGDTPIIPTDHEGTGIIKIPDLGHGEGWPHLPAPSLPPQGYGIFWHEKSFVSDIAFFKDKDDKVKMAICVRYEAYIQKYDAYVLCGFLTRDVDAPLDAPWDNPTGFKVLKGVSREGVTTRATLSNIAVDRKRGKLFCRIAGGVNNYFPICESHILEYDILTGETIKHNDSFFAIEPDEKRVNNKHYEYGGRLIWSELYDTLVTFTTGVFMGPPGGQRAITYPGISRYGENWANLKGRLISISFPYGFEVNRKLVMAPIRITKGTPNEYSQVIQTI